MMTSAAGMAALPQVGGRHTLWAETVPGIDARVVASNIPGASAIAQVGTFLTGSPCGSPIPTKFHSFIQPGAVLDPTRILVGAKSNFGAPLASGVGAEGAFLSIDPTGSDSLSIPPRFASSGEQASTFGGRVQMLSANSPFWRNSVNNPDAFTAAYTGVSNPLGLSNNNAFGRLWPANAPFGLNAVGSSSILDPTGIPLKGAPNPGIGGVYVGSLTNRDAVTSPSQPQVIPGALRTGAVGTAFLGPSPDGTCRAVFCVVTADGAMVQEHTVKGLDGLAPAVTVQPLIGQGWDPPNQHLDPRLGVLMNPYVPAPSAGVVQQLFVSEPFTNTIAVIDLIVVGTTPNQVFAAVLPISRLSADALHQPVDLAPAEVETESTSWASNTTLEQGADFYVVNHADHTIVRMSQAGDVVAMRRVQVDSSVLDNANLNGIATSADGTTLYVTFTGPGTGQGGVLELPAFST